MSGGPRAGDCADASLEKYLIPTVTVPPTNTKKGVSPRLARIIPSAANRQSGVDVRLDGMLRSRATATEAPTLEIKAVDLGSAPTSYSFNSRVNQWIADTTTKGYFGTGGNADIFLEIAKKRAAKSNVNSFSRVPRYGVKRTNYAFVETDSTTLTTTDVDYYGVTTNFEAWPDISAQNLISAGYTGIAGTWKVFGQPRLLEAPDGKLLLWHLARKSTGEYDIVVSKFDPKSETLFSHYASLKDTTTQYMADVFRFSSIPIAAGAAGSTGYPVGIAPVVFGDGVYCVICVAAPVTGLGYLFTVQLVGDELSPVLASTSSQGATHYARPVPLPELYVVGTDNNQESSEATDIINPITRFGGIDAVALNGKVRVAVGLKCPGYCSLADNRTVAYLDTTDFNTWGDSDEGGTDLIGPIPRLSAIGSFAQSSDIQLNDLCRASQSVVYGCGPKGTVFQSSDNGQSWKKLDTRIDPSQMKSGQSIDLLCIYGDAAGTIYAGGHFGTVIKSSDFGVTWQVVRSALPASEFIVPFASTGLTGNQTFYSSAGSVASSSAVYGIAVKADPDFLWVCGAGGFVDYSGDGGTTWTNIVQWRPSAIGQEGNYYSIVNYTGNSIVVGGDSQVHNTTTITDTRDQKKRALRITNATTAKTYPSVDMTFEIDVNLPTSAVYGPGGDRIVRFRNYGSTSQHIAIDASGHIYATDATGAVFTYSHRPAIGYTGIIRDIYTDARDVSNTLTIDDAFIIEEDASGKTTIWSTAQFGNLIDFPPSTPADWYRQIAVPLSRPRAISLRDQDIGTVVGLGGTYANGGRLAPRIRPRMLVLPNGKIMLVALNLANGKVEHWEFANDSDPAIYKGVVVGFSADDDFDPDAGFSTGFVPTPSLTIDENGVVILGWGCLAVGASIPDKIRVSLESDGYQSWTSGSASVLPLPIGHIQAQSADYTKAAIYGTRDTLAFSRGRIFTTVVDSDLGSIGIFAARDFKRATDDNPTNFVPIIPGRNQWSGIHDLMVKFSGFPLAGDIFTAEPIWSYQTSNLVIESPSVLWRGASVTSGSVSSVTLTWDRLDDTIEEQLGVGDTWDVSALAMFGTNFNAFNFGLYDSSDSLITETTVTQSLETGTATGPGGGNITSVALNASANMIPSQYKLGAGRTFYLKIVGGANGGKVFRILDNGRNSILIENATNIGSSFSYLIFGDRLFADLTSALTDSTKYKARYIKITISGQRTVDNYFKIGTAIIGNYVTYTPHTGNESRRRFAEGFGWRPIPSSVLQRGDSGVSSIEHIGFQRAWTLPYEQIQWWDRDMHMNGLMPAMRQAFAIMFNGNDTETAPNSLYLVRLNDGPETTNTYQDRYSYTLQLEEVV